MTTSYIEYFCFGHYNTIEEDCLRGCSDAPSCMKATQHIPHAPIRELVEYLASPDYSLRSRAKTRLEKLQEEGLDCNNAYGAKNSTAV